MVQAAPPENPHQQVQVKPPFVLTQVALAEQSSVALTHSLMSVVHVAPSYLQVKAAI